MGSKTTIKHNKLIQLENSMLMYGTSNVETLAKVTTTVHCIHNTSSSHDKLFAWQQISLTLKSLYENALGSQYCSINSLLYLRTVQDRYVSLYKEFITTTYLQNSN